MYLTSTQAQPGVGWPVPGRAVPQHSRVPGSFAAGVPRSLSLPGTPLPQLLRCPVLSKRLRQKLSLPAGGEPCTATPSLNGETPRVILFVCSFLPLGWTSFFPLPKLVYISSHLKKVAKFIQLMDTCWKITRSEPQYTDMTCKS